MRYTSHSVCRAAAQWARGYGGNLLIIRNVGRWVAYGNLFMYVAEAKKTARSCRHNNDGHDVVHDMWFFDTDTMVDSMEKAG